MSFRVTAPLQDNTLPDGLYPAVCTTVAILGVQPSRDYEPQEKIWLRWDLPGQKSSWRDRRGREHNMPMLVGKQYTLSLWPKANLRKDLDSWRGRAFTAEELSGGFLVSDMLGKPCMVEILNKRSGERSFPNVVGVLPLPADAEVPVSTADLIAYDCDEPDPNLFAALPKWIQETIDSRIRDVREPKPAPVRAPAEPIAATADFNDEIPF
jgi:hypothetical protein